MKMASLFGMRNNGQILLAEDHLAVVFDYDAALVAEVKLINGAKWDRSARVWRVPLSSLNEVRSFATQNDMWVSPDLVMLELPARDVDYGGVRFDDDWIWLGFNYDRVLVTGVKQIPGVTWDSKTKAWKAPITSVEETIEFCGRFNLHVPEDLQSHAHEVMEHGKVLIDASRAIDAEVEVGELPLLPYQRAGVAYALKAKRCFIADDMGLGKTIQSIATIEAANAYPAVVVCPPTLVLNWKAEYEKWLPDRRVVVVTDRKRFPELGEYDVVVLGWSNIVHWEQQAKNHKALIADESHYAKSYDAKRTKAVVKVAKTVPEDGYVLALTGTPVTNRPAEYAAQLEMMGRLGDLGGKWGFYRRYCNAYRDRWGQWHIDGNSNLDELNNKLRATCYVRRVKEQVLEDLPPVRHAPLVLAGDTAPMADYRRAEADIVKYLIERAEEIALELGISVKSAKVRARIAAESNEHLVRLSVLRRLAARAKMGAIVEWVEQVTGEGRKVVIAAHHREIVSDLAHKFGGLKIQGGQDVAEVERHKHLFQTLPVEEAPVIVLSIQAAKTGHTLTAAQDVLFCELPWNWADVEQTYSRCHRLGQKGSVTATYMLAANTVDEDIYDLVQRKRDVVSAATDGGEVGRDNSATLIVGKYLQLGLDRHES
jgi:SNF2 family DNA or RNA helicase